MQDTINDEWIIQSYWHFYLFNANLKLTGAFHNVQIIILSGFYGFVQCFIVHFFPESVIFYAL